jgi:pimeloyl-ACP methyl ester carboxylesterase
MANLYCITGLGADHRFFANLSVKGHTLIPLLWVQFSKTDTLQSYAVKMATQIPEQNPIIIGLSFGGMLATEIANHMPVKKLVLISSAKTANEAGYRSGILKALHNFTPSFIFNLPLSPLIFLFGAHTSDERTLLKDVIQKSDPALVKWSIGAILSWRNNIYPNDTIHIHGTSDRIILPAGVKPTHWIKDGSHIMIYNRPEEISNIISGCL